MTRERMEQFLEVVEQARKGHEAAKAILLLTMETERKPGLLWRLRAGDVWDQDLFDALHDLEMRVRERIEQLRLAKAYFSWEDRIIRTEICRKYRGRYRKLGEPLETVSL